jgi:hypothetical protein
MIAPSKRLDRDWHGGGMGWSRDKTNSIADFLQEIADPELFEPEIANRTLYSLGSNIQRRAFRHKRKRQPVNLNDL